GGHVRSRAAPRQGDERVPKLLCSSDLKLGNDIVIDQVVRLFQGPTLGVQPITKTYGTHPITQNFHDYTVYPQTRTVEPDSAGKKGLTVTALVKTSASSWAETKV